MTVVQIRFIDQLDKSEIDFKQQQLVTKQISEIELALIANEQRLDFLDLEDYILLNERKFESVSNRTEKIESEIDRLNHNVVAIVTKTNEVSDDQFETTMNRIEQLNNALEGTDRNFQILSEGLELISVMQNATTTDLLKIDGKITRLNTENTLFKAAIVQNVTRLSAELATQANSIQSNFDSVAFLTTSLRNQYMEFSPLLSDIEERVRHSDEDLVAIKNELEKNQHVENEIMRLNTRQSLLSEQINSAKSELNTMKVEFSSKMVYMSEAQEDQKVRINSLTDSNPLRHKLCETRCRNVGNRQRCFIYDCDKSSKSDYCDGNNDCQSGLFCENR